MKGVKKKTTKKKVLATKTMRLLHGKSLVAITDSLNSPIGELSDDVLIAMSDMSSIVDSLVAPLSVINALIVAVASKKREEVKNKFENFEELWKSRSTLRD